MKMVECMGDMCVIFPVELDLDKAVDTESNGVSPRVLPQTYATYGYIHASGVLCYTAARYRIGFWASANKELQAL